MLYQYCCPLFSKAYLDIEQVKKRESGETGKLEDVFESPVQTTDIESQVTKDEKTSEVGIQNDEDHLEVETSEQKNGLIDKIADSTEKLEIQLH